MGSGLLHERLGGKQLLKNIKATSTNWFESFFLTKSPTLKRVEEKETHLQETLNIGKIEYEPELSLLHLGEGTKKLTTKENMLLRLLVQNQNELLDRQAALRAVWGDDNYFNGRSMDVYIAKLRKLLKEDSSIEIMNVHGIGFKLLVKQ